MLRAGVGRGRRGKGAAKSWPFEGASYVLDFLGGSLAPAIGSIAPTFTRTSIATYLDSDGVLKTAQANVPRFDYDPVTRACRGLLIEESRTNLLLHSSTFDATASGGAWTNNVAPVTSNTVTSPDGTVNADTITITASTEYVFQTVTVVASTAYTFSIYVKLGTMAAGDYKVAFYNSTGAAFISTDVLPTTGTPTATGWTRLTYAVTTPVGCVSMRVYAFRNSATITNPSTVYVWGAQLEVGAFATSYIPTAGATVTRQADVCTLATSNLPSFSATQGTLLASALPPNAASVFSRVVELSNGTSSEAISLQRNAASIRCYVTVGGAAQFTEGSLPSSPAAAVINLAFGYAANDLALSANGAAPALDASALVPTVTQLQVASSHSGGSQINGHIRQIAYWPTRLANARLQEITA